MIWLTIGFAIYLLLFAALRQMLKSWEVQDDKLQEFEFSLSDVEIKQQVMNLRWVQQGGRKREHYFYFVAILFIFVLDAALLGCHPGFLLSNIPFNMAPRCL